MECVMRQMVVRCKQGKRVKGLEYVKHSGNSDVVTYTFTADFGYIMKLVQNNDDGKTLMHRGDYSKFNEIQVLAPPPDSDNSYFVTLKPGEEQFVCLRSKVVEGETFNKAEYKNVSHAQLILPDDELITKCLEEGGAGVKKERKPGIF